MCVGGDDVGNFSWDSVGIWRESFETRIARSQCIVSGSHEYAPCPCFRRLSRNNTFVMRFSENLSSQPHQLESSGDCAMSHQPPDALLLATTLKWTPLNASSSPPTRFPSSSPATPPPSLSASINLSSPKLSLLLNTASVMSGEAQDEQFDDASQFGGPGAPTPLGQLEVHSSSPNSNRVRRSYA